MYSTLYGHIPADLNNPETPPSSVKGGTEEVSARDRQSSSVQKQLENVENNLPFSDTDTDRKSLIVTSYMYSVHSICVLYVQ